MDFILLLYFFHILVQSLLMHPKEQVVPRLVGFVFYFKQEASKKGFSAFSIKLSEILGCTVFTICRKIEKMCFHVLDT